MLKGITCVNQHIASIFNMVMISCRMDKYFVKDVAEFRKLLRGVLPVLPPNSGHLMGFRQDF